MKQMHEFALIAMLLWGAMEKESERILKPHCNTLLIVQRIPDMHR